MIKTNDKTICLYNHQIRESFYRYFDKSANFAMVKWSQDNFHCPLGLKILDITQYTQINKNTKARKQNFGKIF